MQELAATHVADDVLVGLEIADDAAVYRISDELAIVVTVDFFTPIVDDPYQYGAIAAANSLSDIYAMGAQPILALNVAGVPSELPLDMVAEIFRGGGDKAREAGILVAGGHSVRDKEPKYGLVVLGTVHPDRLKTKGGAQPGDRLFLSKPLGTGVITTALMQDRAGAEEVEAATASMLLLNRGAAEVARAHGASALTDVTGFGLLGHLAEMAHNGSIGFELAYSSLPWLPGAERLAEAGAFPGGAYDNQHYFSNRLRFDAALAPWRRTLCLGPETSGGLLMTLPADRVRDARRAAEKTHVALIEIGRATHEPVILVRA